MSELRHRPKPDWGKVVIDGREYLLVGPGHPLYSYDEAPDEDCDFCGGHQQYRCGGCNSGWCRGCFDSHLQVAHHAKLVSKETEMNTF